MLLGETIRIALQSIRGNLFRAALTMLGIGFAAGIFKPLISATVRATTDGSNKPLGSQLMVGGRRTVVVRHGKIREFRKERNHAVGQVHRRDSYLTEFSHRNPASPWICSDLWRQEMRSLVAEEFFNHRH